MRENYTYPIDPDWSNDKLLAVMKVFTDVEDAYENKLSVAVFEKDWTNYLKFVPSKMEQKTIDRQFKQLTDYSIYRVMQAIAQAKTKTIKMESEEHHAN